ncbi:MAG: hypothetical protein JJE25_08105, partial [Bacteroidia bacterium]|nr:hypothetical protein [Bacteroidia bacterium]
LKHIGLEDAEEFLLKTENGINNLLLISREKKLNEDELKEIPLMRTCFLLKKTFLQRIYLFKFRLFYSLIKKNLLSSNPSLLLFDFYKLGILAQRGRG